MLYLLGLLLIIGLILGGFSGSLPFSFGTISSILNNLRRDAVEFIFPDSENKILIDELNSNYNILDKFFSESPESILKSTDIPKKEKEAYKQASEAFQKTKNQIKTLGSEATKNEPSILESLIKKTLGLESNENSPDPTHIPPNCNLACE